MCLYLNSHLVFWYFTVITITLCNIYHMKFSLTQNQPRVDMSLCLSRKGVFVIILLHLMEWFCEKKIFNELNITIKVSCAAPISSQSLIRCWGVHTQLIGTTLLLDTCIKLCIHELKYGITPQQILHFQPTARTDPSRMSVTIRNMLHLRWFQMVYGFNQNYPATPQGTSHTEKAWASIH